jgi:hypothetical protein
MQILTDTDTWYTVDSMQESRCVSVLSQGLDGTVSIQFEGNSPEIETFAVSASGTGWQRWVPLGRRRLRWDWSGQQRDNFCVLVVVGSAPPIPACVEGVPDTVREFRANGVYTDLASIMAEIMRLGPYS